MKAYKFVRGLLKASAFAAVMFVMQACYGTPHDDPYWNDDENEQVNDTTLNLYPDIPREMEAE